nr:MFS transporter [Candidatus Sigynarchaeota archaeon]
MEGTDIDANEAKSKVKTGTKVIFQKMWPSFMSTTSHTLIYAWSGINIILLSNLLWPGEPYHASEMGFSYGVGIYTVALSSIVFGLLADRYSRIKLFTIIDIVYGAGIIVLGFLPAGLGTPSYVYFLSCMLITYAFDTGQTIRVSYADDRADESERSQFFGLSGLFWQLAWMIGGFISALVFKDYWRQYFWISGAVTVASGLIISVKGVEPKRGAEKKELKSVLKLDGVEYKYHVNVETFKKTILAPTNIIAFIEGFFTQIVYAIPVLITFAYFQSAPYNISPFVMSIVTFLFGIPGAVVSASVLAKLSDKWGKKAIKNRVYVIIFSLMATYGALLGVFLIPAVPMSPEEGGNLAFFFSHPTHWLIAIMIFAWQMTGGMYSSNQAPVLQKINLPEAQGAMSSANQFLESLGHGTGAIVSGILLSFLNNNYQFTVLIMVLIGFVGSSSWFLTLKWINADVGRVSGILQQRAKEMETKR